MRGVVTVLEPIHPKDHPSVDALKAATRAALIAALPESHRPGIVDSPAAKVAR
jgi:hypothetical protein